MTHSRSLAAAAPQSVTERGDNGGHKRERPRSLWTILAFLFYRKSLDLVLVALLETGPAAVKRLVGSAV